MSDKILIVGLGSIGQRHARNTLAMGCEVVWVDQRGESFPVSHTHQAVDIQEGLESEPLGVIIATPPATHWQIGFEVSKAKLPCLIEKPLAPTLGEAEGLRYVFEKEDIPLAVGYQLRHTAALRRLKAQADAGEFGTIYAAHAEFASQKWCSHTYPADLLLECSHELDLLRWVLGNPTHAVACKDKTRSVYSAQLLFADSVGTVYLDGIAPGYRRRLTFYGTKGVGEWTLDQVENDQTYVDELAEFLRVCRGEQAEPSCAGRDGWWAIRICEAIRKSGESGRWEAV